jgi:hypothetical protein
VRGRPKVQLPDVGRDLAHPIRRTGVSRVLVC